MTHDTTARRASAAIAALAGATLMLRVVLRTADTGSVVEALSYMTHYFTILTNTLVFLVMLRVALGGAVSARILSALTVAIACVGLIYHLLLAHLLDLSGLDLLADHGVHTFVPIATIVWWRIFAAKPALSLPLAAAWIAWPLVYCGYILTRAGLFGGFYPYPFLNLPALGVSGLVVNIAGLLVAFVAVGLVLHLIAGGRGRA